jgi:hypothetical protein
MKGLTLNFYLLQELGRKCIGLFQLICANIEKFSIDTYDSYLLQQIRLASERGFCKRIQYVHMGELSKAVAQPEYLNTMYCLRNSLRGLSLVDCGLPNTAYSQFQILD